MSDVMVLELLQPPDALPAEFAQVLQGPPGPPGPAGGTAAAGALLTANRLSEFAADPAAQEDAQANLGLGADPLAYYILAKA